MPDGPLPHCLYNFTPPLGKLELGLCLAMSFLAACVGHMNSYQICQIGLITIAATILSELIPEDKARPRIYFDRNAMPKTLSVDTAREWMSEFARVHCRLLQYAFVCMLSTVPLSIMAQYMRTKFDRRFMHMCHRYSLESSSERASLSLSRSRTCRRPYFQWP